MPLCESRKRMRLWLNIYIHGSFTILLDRQGYQSQYNNNTIAIVVAIIITMMGILMTICNIEHFPFP